MPFVRHRLGALRLKRIPELHVREDDTAERGTRVLQHPRRAGAGRDAWRTVAADAPADAARPRTACGASRSRGPRAAVAAARRRRARRVATEAAVAPIRTLASLTPADLAVVPDEAVVERLQGARRVLAVGHESPDADAFGSALGLALAVEYAGRAGDRC